MSTTPPATPAATTPTTGTPPPTLPVALHVEFLLNTPDNLRQINFGLEKDTDGTTVNWTIIFTLFERTDPTVAYSSPLISLKVFVAAELHPHAEQAVAGLTPVQTAHATGPAANAAKKVHDGTMPKPVGDLIIQNTLK